MLFSPVSYKSKIVFDLIKIIDEAPEWFDYYNFKAIPVPKEIWEKDSLLANLAKVRKFHAGILKMDPNTCYNWHIDTDRHVALNMLVCDDGNSKCIFAPDGFAVVNPIVELSYQPYTYYVFNTKYPHTVFNFSEPRYLFSLEFLEEDRGLTYDELCADIQGLDYVD